MLYSVELYDKDNDYIKTLAICTSFENAKRHCLKVYETMKEKEIINTDYSFNEPFDWVQISVVNQNKVVFVNDKISSWHKKTCRSTIKSVKGKVKERGKTWNKLYC